MNQTKQAPRKSRSVFACLMLVVSAQADDYLEARTELIAAYQQADYTAMRVAANKALVARPEFPGALFNLALAQSLAGDDESSLLTLEALLRKGVDFGVAELDEFASLRKLDAWNSYDSRVKGLHEPVGGGTVAATLNAPEFVPEGIAIDESGDVYLGSIRTGEIVRATGDVKTISNGDGHWSVFGMRFHSDGSLWFASAAVDQLADVDADLGKTGLFQLDIESGQVTHAAILPQNENLAQVLGDLIIADSDTIYTTDSVTGAVYQYRISANEFEPLIAPGRLGSPQGLVLDESGTRLYIADYIGGVFCVSLGDGRLVKLEVDANITDYGVDGLYRYGDKLIAIQNGIRPHRVVEFELSSDKSSVTALRTLAANLEEFDEPTLGTLYNGDFYFVANSHWNRFDQENNLPEGLDGPIVLRITLTP